MSVPSSSAGTKAIEAAGREGGGEGGSTGVDEEGVMMVAFALVADRVGNGDAVSP